MCSKAAFPALAALDTPLASMISFPLCCTLGMNVLVYHSYPTKSRAGLPFTVAQARSGDMVGEWLPQTTTFAISATTEPVFSATCQTALSWSSLVIAAKFLLGKSLAWVAAIKQLVFAGFPTTKVFTFLLAYSLRAWPWGIKILAFYCKRSALYIPFPLGLAPTKMAASTSWKPVLRLSVTTMLCSSGKAQSPIYIATPERALRAWGTSMRCRMTGWS